MLEIVNNICFLIVVGLFNYDIYKRNDEISILTIASIICMIGLAICIILRIIFYP